MAEINLNSDSSGIAGILSQITPIIETMMNLMITFYLIKMMMGMFQGFA